MRFPEALKGLDWSLVGLLLVIQVFGVLGVYSASLGEGSPIFFKKHILYLLVGWAAIFIIAREKFRNFLDLSLYLYLFVLFLLLMVLVVGKEVYGARRWLGIGPFGIQPSEFMKLSLILLASCLLPHIKTLWDRRAFLLAIAFAMPTVITLKQPDLGTTVTYFIPLGAMVLARGVRLKHVLALGGLAIAFLPLAWWSMKDYQRERILAVLDPYRDYFGSGYQLIQSVIAVGSGGLTGKGVAKGTQSQLLFLPEAHTDFIFSVIGEELGFFGATVFLAMVFLFLLRILTYVRFVRDTPETLFVVGSFSLLTFQYVTNLLMALGMFPVVGMPLPFVSFGGSSTLTFSLMVGMLMSIYREVR